MLKRKNLGKTLETLGWTLQNQKKKLLRTPPKKKEQIKQLWGSLVSENCFFLGGYFLFFGFPKVFFVFFVFSDFGGSRQESLRIVFFLFWFSYFFIFFLMCF